MDVRKSKKLLALLAAIYWILVIAIYLIAGDQFRFARVATDTLSANAGICEMVDDVTVTQRVVMPSDMVTGVDLMAATFGRTNSGTLHVALIDQDGERVAGASIDMASFGENQYTPIDFDEPLNTRPGAAMTLTLTTTGGNPGSTIVPYCGNTIKAGRAEIIQDIPLEDRCAVNGEPGTGRMCVRVRGLRTLSFYKTYWVIVVVAFAVAAAFCAHWWKQAKQGKNNPLVAVCTLFTRYAFLLRQLVSRDFKTKYKRSVLGMAWSFLNPLLTMAVQYVVFSTLFQSDIPNYPVYLLTGLVFFNFLSEAVSMGMTSITGNASLIKKVYMPKYIYPVSRVFSSLVNFGFAILPLFLVMLFTGTAFHLSLLLLVFDILCLLGFVLGMGLLMTTAMTFFQDTQFLWSVVNLMWMYLTPIFYPESIISAEFLTVYRLNPMYQYITFARTCILDGVSPEPMAYFWCLASSLVVLTLGIVTFKRHQDKFVLYL